MSLIVAMAFFTTGCNGGTNESGSDKNAGTDNAVSVGTPNQTLSSDTPSPDAHSMDTPLASAISTDSTQAKASQSESGNTSDVSILGKGNTSFNFTVADIDGNETKFEINTDKKTVGDALLELNLIAGDKGPYGLYVKTVNGISIDYDKDGAYWAFYVDGKYAQAGVDSTEIKNGESYSFKAEK